jgi:hypothetical protein
MDENGNGVVSHYSLVLEDDDDVRSMFSTIRGEERSINLHVDPLYYVLCTII